MTMMIGETMRHGRLIWFNSQLSISRLKMSCLEFRKEGVVFEMLCVRKTSVVAVVDAVVIVEIFAPVVL